MHSDISAHFAQINFRYKDQEFGWVVQNKEVVKRILKLGVSITTLRALVLIGFSIVGVFASFIVTRNVQDEQFRQRALAVAKAVSAMPEVIDLAEHGDPKRALQSLTKEIAAKTGATYIVVANKDGVRMSHPNPKEIGIKIDGVLLALQGKSYTTLNNGSLGRSANGKTPIINYAGQIVGLVSAGFLISNFTNDIHNLELAFLGFGLGSILIGLLLSALLGRATRERLIRQELGLAQSTLAQREAVLHAIKEGVITFDSDNRVILINDEAKRLLELNDSVIGRSMDMVLSEGRLLDLLQGSAAQGDDEVLLNDKFSLRVQRRAVKRGGKSIGAVVTIRDRTEHIDLLRELDSVKNLTNALRAQQHEHSNRIHTINGLLELARFEEAKSYLGEIGNSDAALAEYLNNSIGNPTIMALILAKYSIARERGVDLTIHANANLLDLALDPNALITVIGNLLDNALDAVAGQPEAKVTLEIANFGDFKRILVSDNGNGLPEPDPFIVFEDGYSTKRGDAREHFGLGLPILKRLVLQGLGSVNCYNEQGAVFEILLPRSESAERKEGLIQR
jgi:two-component system CitB family sensor kinase